jgi:hypothetical protein
MRVIITSTARSTELAKQVSSWKSVHFWHDNAALVNNSEVTR